jgi:hypothetical protein
LQTVTQNKIAQLEDRYFFLSFPSPSRAERLCSLESMSVYYRVSRFYLSLLRFLNNFCGLKLDSNRLEKMAELQEAILAALQIHTSKSAKTSKLM